MTQAYTVRQLEFFHAALNIINAAIVDADQVKVPETPIVSEADNTATIGAPPAPIAPISVAGLSAQQPPILTEPDDTRTSAVFFNSLPWQTPAPQTARIPSPPTAGLLAQEATAKSFFHGLPWQGNTKTGDVTETAKHLDVSSIAELATQTALQAAQKSASLQNQPTAKTASGFFQSLPW